MMNFPWLKVKEPERIYKQDGFGIFIDNLDLRNYFDRFTAEEEEDKKQFIGVRAFFAYPASHNNNNNSPYASLYVLVPLQGTGEFVVLNFVRGLELLDEGRPISMVIKEKSGGLDLFPEEATNLHEYFLNWRDKFWSATELRNLRNAEYGGHPSVLEKIQKWQGFATNEKDPVLFINQNEPEPDLLLKGLEVCCDSAFAEANHLIKTKNLLIDSPAVSEMINFFRQLVWTAAERVYFADSSLPLQHYLLLHLVLAVHHRFFIGYLGVLCQKHAANTSPFVAGPFPVPWYYYYNMFEQDEQEQQCENFVSIKYPDEPPYVYPEPTFSGEPDARYPMWLQDPLGIEALKAFININPWFHREVLSKLEENKNGFSPLVFDYLTTRPEMLAQLDPKGLMFTREHVSANYQKIKNLNLKAESPRRVFRAFCSEVAKIMPKAYESMLAWKYQEAWVCAACNNQIPNGQITSPYILIDGPAGKQEKKMICHSSQCRGLVADQPHHLRHYPLFYLPVVCQSRRACFMTGASWSNLNNPLNPWLSEYVSTVKLFAFAAWTAAATDNTRGQKVILRCKLPYDPKAEQHDSFVQLYPTPPVVLRSPTEFNGSEADIRDFVYLVSTDPAVPVYDPLSRTFEANAWYEQNRKLISQPVFTAIRTWIVNQLRVYRLTPRADLKFRELFKTGGLYLATHSAALIHALLLLVIEGKLRLKPTSSNQKWQDFLIFFKTLGSPELCIKVLNCMLTNKYRNQPEELYKYAMVLEYKEKITQNVKNKLPLLNQL